MRTKPFLSVALAITLAAACGSDMPAKNTEGGSPGGTAGSASTGGTGGRPPIPVGGRAGSPSATGGSGGSTSMGGSTGTAGSGGSAGSGSGDASVDTGGARDAGASDSRPSDTGGAGTGDAGGMGATGKVTCGTMKADVTKVKGGSEGIVIGPDGTIYWSQFGANLGRFKPPYDSPEPSWAKMPDGNAQVLGITLDPKRKVIYAGARGSRKMYRVSTDDPTKVDTLAPVESGVNGVTLGEDEAVYYTDQDGGNVYRISADGMKSKVTAMTLPDLNGIAFGPDGKLYVLQYGDGVLWRLTLANRVEQSREMLVKVAGSNADGIAFDKAGRMYVTASGLHLVSADGKTSTRLGSFSGANIDFGAGALSCNDLYGVAGFNRRDMLDQPGMDVPWHRQ